MFCKSSNESGWRCGVMLLVFLSSAPLCAEEPPKTVFGQTVDHIWHDQKRMLTAPLRTSRVDLIVWGGAAASLLVLAPKWGGNRSLDEQFEERIDRDVHRTSSFLHGITHAGDPAVLIGGSLLMYGVGYGFEQPRLATGSLHAFEGLIDTGIVLILVKVIAGRSRPGSTPVDSEFHGPVGYFDSADNDSFPSGHAAMSFAAATVVSHEAENRWVSLGAYSLASVVAYSRIYVEKHWASDVIAGAALGYSVGVLVEKHRHAKNPDAAQIVPTMQGDALGLAWVKQW